MARQSQSKSDALLDFVTGLQPIHSRPHLSVHVKDARDAASLSRGSFEVMKLQCIQHIINSFNSQRFISNLFHILHLKIQMRMFLLYCIKRKLSWNISWARQTKPASLE